MLAPCRLFPATRFHVVLMLVINTYTAPDAFGGTGVFASQPVAAGTVIWRYAPVIDLFFSFEAFMALPSARRNAMGKHAYPARVHGAAGVMYSRDNDRFTNHSFTPNTGEASDGTVVALRDIAAGEEITANYFGFVVGGLPPFYTQLPCYDFLLKEAAGALTRTDDVLRLCV